MLFTTLLFCVGTARASLWGGCASWFGCSNGRHIYNFPDGAHYDGEWKLGKRDGHGTLTKANGNKFYEGNWKADKRDGFGVLTAREGEKYEGYWKGGLHHGTGIYKWADGRRYQGKWQDDKQHGLGTQTFPDGQQYEGEWKNGLQHGQGIFTFADGRTFASDWEDGKPTRGEDGQPHGVYNSKENSKTLYGKPARSPHDGKEDSTPTEEEL